MDCSKLSSLCCQNNPKICTHVLPSSKQPAPRPVRKRRQRCKRSFGSGTPNRRRDVPAPVNEIRRRRELNAMSLRRLLECILRCSLGRLMGHLGDLIQFICYALMLPLHTKTIEQIQLRKGFILAQ